MKRILFVYDHPYNAYWKDGLWAAVDYLQKYYEIVKWNIADKRTNPFASSVKQPRFILGWGGFRSSIDNLLQTINDIPKGLCLAGNAFPYEGQKYDVLFYETDWTKKWLEETKKAELPPLLIKAFGYNSQIYQLPASEPERIIDYLTVGAFAAWKRQARVGDKSGVRVAIGEIQKRNLSESMGIIGPLLLKGVMISDMMSPERLRRFYHLSKVCYIPANVYGGGERASMEAAACGCKVEIDSDNPKLAEIINTPLTALTEIEYAKQLRVGINEILKEEYKDKPWLIRNELIKE